MDVVADIQKMPDINSAFIAQHRAQGEGDREEERVTIIGVGREGRWNEQGG